MGVLTQQMTKKRALTKKTCVASGGIVAFYLTPKANWFNTSIQSIYRRIRRIVRVIGKIVVVMRNPLKLCICWWSMSEDIREKNLINAM